ncbi:bifunctional riboflavin kinase/FAD synthetase [Pseudorhodobacter sp. W20_MBD10_FR17]|uniref:bifunctional riboflavin kinase/FAD synthetase n=1 Tax=Pseudorhodobacter sp. W20_MBD10_FR17 TaxID=3240266 RepID=UPI003F98B6EB
MQVYQHWQGVSPEHRGASVAMGNFDGVHLGHQHVISLAAQHGPLGIVTFEPHPRSYFAPQSGPFRLMNAEARANRLAKLGVQTLFELPFDATLASLSPEAFVTQVLAEGLGVSHVTVGADFCFGMGRKGTAADLVSLCATQGITVHLADLVQVENTDISSTRIRQALSDGDTKTASQMLGHWHRIDGAVIHGEKRGRQLGFPTANMDVTGLHLPRNGVYAVYADVLTGPQKGHYLGAANLGTRPMFGENRPNLETFLFDFKGDLYGQHLSIAFVEWLRGEEKFDSLEALITQMHADCDRARTILQAAK